jgi:endonuclease G
MLLEELLNINLFPQLTEEQKRNTYNLPLSSKDLNLNKEIEYSYWDAESQCEISVSDKDIDMLQNRFRFE